MHYGLELILRGIDPATQHGLEVGPLDNPAVSRAEGHSVVYVDHATTEELRAKYADHDHLGEIVEVDHVWLGEGLSEIIGGTELFDYAIASHVIEHVPDLVGWLDQLSQVLRPGGRLSLIIPDKRFCFDARRPTTEPSQVLAAHIERRVRPTVQQVLEFYSYIIEVDSLQRWAGELGHGDSPIDWSQGVAWAEKSRDSDDYHDVHCWAFTPQSFVETLDAINGQGLSDLIVEHFTATPPGALEFFVTLRRAPAGISAAELAEQQRTGLAGLDLGVGTDVDGRPIVGSNVEEPEIPTGHRPMIVSDAEHRLLTRKRSSLTAVRSAAQRLRSRRRG